MVREHYGTDNVTVVLDWIEEQHVKYNLTITTPSMSILERQDIVESRSAQLTLSYNTVYSVRFVATLCGQNSTINFELQYGEFTLIMQTTTESAQLLCHIHTFDTAVTCDHPSELPTTAVVSGYRNPALVGTNITISTRCSHGDNTLTGMNATFINIYTCTSDGQWEPDPKQINVDLCNNGNPFQMF